MVLDDFLQLFRRVAAALPGMETNEKAKEDSMYRFVYFFSRLCMQCPNLFNCFAWFLLVVEVDLQDSSSEPLNQEGRCSC